MPENLQISSRHQTVDSEYLENYPSRNNENYKAKAMHGKVIPSFMITKKSVTSPLGKINWKHFPIKEKR